MLFKKVIIFPAPPLFKKVHLGVARREVPPSVSGGLEGAADPLIAKRILDM
jgi:hypothetical protein